MKKIILLTFLWLNNSWAANQDQSSTVFMDLDMIYSLGDTDVDIERNIGFLTDRIVRLHKQGLKTVQLAAFSNPDAVNKFYTNVFFPTTHLNEPGVEISFSTPVGQSDSPYSGNIFARTAKAIKAATNGKVEIYAWMPILSYRIKPDSNYYWGVEYVKSDLNSENNDPNRYKRLSPFSPTTWDIVADIYADLAISAGQYIDGIAFHDDGMMSDHEDVSASAVWFYRNVWGYSNATRNSESITTNPQLELAWAVKKAVYINKFTLYMADVSSRFIGYYYDRDVKLKTSRHIYASALLDDRAYTWLGQEPDSLYSDYDSVSIEAYPYMEARFNISVKNNTRPLCFFTTSPSCMSVNENTFYSQLTSAAKKYDGNLEKTLFIFQTVDWTNYGAQNLPDKSLGGAMLKTLEKGVNHIGWYPDLYFPDTKFPYISGQFEQALNKTR